MKNYICSFIVTAILGSVLGIITEFSLIYHIKWLITITQNELFWVVIAICVGLYVGNIVYLIKEKIRGKKISNNIPKLSIIFMTLFLIIGIVVDTYRLYNSILHIQPVYLICILSITGYIFGTILGILRNKK